MLVMNNECLKFFLSKEIKSLQTVNLTKQDIGHDHFTPKENTPFCFISDILPTK